MYIPTKAKTFGTNIEITHTRATPVIRRCNFEWQKGVHFIYSVCNSNRLDLSMKARVASRNLRRICRVDFSTFLRSRFGRIPKRGRKETSRSRLLKRGWVVISMLFLWSSNFGQYNKKCSGVSSFLQQWHLLLRETSWNTSDFSNMNIALSYF